MVKGLNAEEHILAYIMKQDCTSMFRDLRPSRQFLCCRINFQGDSASISPPETWNMM